MACTVSQPVLATEAVQALVSAAVAHASAAGARVTVAVLDGQANVSGLIRMQGALPATADIASDKAWTSLLSGRSTRDATQRLAAMPEATREAILRRPRYTVFSGGVPVVVEGALVGAVGVSGATPDLDDACARAALAAIGADVDM